MAVKVSTFTATLYFSWTRCWKWLLLAVIALLGREVLMFFGRFPPNEAELLRCPLVDVFMRHRGVCSGVKGTIATFAKREDWH